MFAFVRRSGGGGRKSSSRSLNEESTQMTADDYELAQKAIFHAAERAEEKLQHAVEQEVMTLFHKDHDDEHHQQHKEKVKAKAKKAVEEGAKKIKQKVKDHPAEAEDRHLPFEKDYPYPYDLPTILAREHKEHRILHAIESAEKALMHAVEDEVSTLFHELEHHEENANVSKKTKSQAKKAITKGMQKSQKAVKEDSDKRRAENDFNFIQEYIEATIFD